MQSGCPSGVVKKCIDQQQVPQGPAVGAHVFRGAGWNVIKVIWGDDWDQLLARDADGLLVRRMNEVNDGQYQKYTVESGAYIREHFFGVHPELLALVADLMKKAAAIANHDGGRLDNRRYQLIVRACDEILDGQHPDMFTLHVWMTGSGTQFNMNVNEVISNRSCQLAGTPLGSKTPVHPNDHVNMSQSSNDTFPSAMSIAAAVNVSRRLIPAVASLRDSIDAKAHAWSDIVKIGRTHLQDATPLTLGQEWSGYTGMLTDNLERLEAAVQGVYRLALGGTAVGTGINAAPGFAEAAAFRHPLRRAL